MPETTQTPPPAAPQPTTGTPPAFEAATPPPAAEVLGAAGIEALRKERADRAAAEKRADELDARLKAIEAKDMTELQQAQARLAELEKENTAEKAQRLRLQVANTHNVGPDDLVLLTGTTEDELTAQATRIAALNAGRAAATATPAFAPSPGQHAGNGTPPAPTATVAAGAELYRQRNPRPTP